MLIHQQIKLVGQIFQCLSLHPQRQEVFQLMELMVQLQMTFPQHHLYLLFQKLAPIPDQQVHLLIILTCIIFKINFQRLIQQQTVIHKMFIPVLMCQRLVIMVFDQMTTGSHHKYHPLIITIYVHNHHHNCLQHLMDLIKIDIPIQFKDQIHSQDTIHNFNQIIIILMTSMALLMTKIPIFQEFMHTILQDCTIQDQWKLMDQVNLQDVTQKQTLISQAKGPLAMEVDQMKWATETPIEMVIVMDLMRWATEIQTDIQYMAMDIK